MVYFTGHGQQKNLHGHDDGCGQEPEAQTVHLPHPPEHEVRNVNPNSIFIYN